VAIAAAQHLSDSKAHHGLDGDEQLMTQRYER